MIVRAASRTDNRDRLTAAELRARWLQMMHDPLVAAIPYKVELNEKGTIEVSPPTTRHAMLQAFLAGELRNQRPEGTTLGECGVETEIGVRMPDVMWASPEFMRRNGMVSPLPQAPDLCVEVLSPSNTRPEMKAKTAAYLAAGAREVWIVPETGPIEIVTERGPQTKSTLGFDVEFPA